MFQITPIKKKQGQSEGRDPLDLFNWTAVISETSENLQHASDLFQNKEYRAKQEMQKDLKACPETDKESEAWVRDENGLDPLGKTSTHHKLRRGGRKECLTRMPLTHLADPRPHHLPHPPTTNITIGEDTYTVLGKTKTKTKTPTRCSVRRTTSPSPSSSASPTLCLVRRCPLLFSFTLWL